MEGFLEQQLDPQEADRLLSADPGDPKQLAEAVGLSEEELEAIDGEQWEPPEDEGEEGDDGLEGPEPEDDPDAGPLMSGGMVLLLVLALAGALLGPEWLGPLSVFVVAGVLEKVPGVQNWIERLPAALRAAWHRSIVYRAAVHMHRKGMPVGMAIASALNWAKHICRTRDVKQWRGPQTVNPKSWMETCAALTLWATMRATARATKG